MRKSLRTLFSYLPAPRRQVLELKLILLSNQELIMSKLDELQTEVQETKAASAAVLEALSGTRTQITDLQAKLAEALAANDGEATNAKIQEAIDGLNAVQADLAAALPQAPNEPGETDPNAPVGDGL